MTEDRPSRSTEAFWGRRRGKTMKPAQSRAYERVMQTALINLANPAPDSLAALFDATMDGFHLEIGFGGGEHLLAHALRQPHTGFIGVEPFVNSMAKMAANMEEAGAKNIRLFDDDATILLDWLPDNCLDGIDLLYPDPWPKKKHWKRRFVSQVNLTRFARVLKPGAHFRFASDIDTYVNWTLNHAHAHPDFKWLADSADDWRNPYPNWVRTRYEAKAVREGRTPCYLTFERV